MRLIPPELRGRCFALLRMLMQSGNPLGGLVAGVLVPLAGLPATILATAFLAIGPAVAGALVAPLLRARGSAVYKLATLPVHQSLAEPVPVRPFRRQSIA